MHQNGAEPPMTCSELPPAGEACWHGGQLGNTHTSRLAEGRETERRLGEAETGGFAPAVPEPLDDLPRQRIRVGESIGLHLAQHLQDVAVLDRADRGGQAVGDDSPRLPAPAPG